MRLLNPIELQEYPGGHGIHALRPSISAYFPILQEIVPSPEGQRDPLGHLMVGAMVPELQVYPLGQGYPEVIPVELQNSFILQVLQPESEVSPVVSEYLPASHRLGTADPLLQYAPAGQANWVGLEEPAGQ